MMRHPQTLYQNSRGNVPSSVREHGQLFGRRKERGALFSLFELTSNMNQCVFSDMPAMWMAYANNTIELNVQ